MNERPVNALTDLLWLVQRDNVQAAVTTKQRLVTRSRWSSTSYWRRWYLQQFEAVEFNSDAIKARYVRAGWVEVVR